MESRDEYCNRTGVTGNTKENLRVSLGLSKDVPFPVSMFWGSVVPILERFSWER